MSWIVDESKKLDDKISRVTLENPFMVERLDGILTDEYYPFIRNELEHVLYPFAPDDELEFDSTYLTPTELGRTLTFMLFDERGFLFFRGRFTIGASGFMLNRTFFLDLPRDTKPTYLFRILEDEHFLAMPPSLEIQNNQFIITFEAGDGFEFSGWNLTEMAKTNISSVIWDNVAMYENSIDGFSTMNDVKLFLKSAYRSYGTE